MSITKFDKQSLVLLKTEILAAVVPVLSKYGVSLNFGRGTFTSSNAKYSIELAVVNSDGVAVTRERTDWAYYAPRRGLRASDLDRDFCVRGEWYTIVGWNRRNRKYPVIAMTRGGGQRYKFPPQTVRDTIVRD